MGTKQKLGIKVFYYYLSKSIPVGLLLLILSFIFYSLNNIIVSKISFLLPWNASIAIVNYLTIGFFVISIIVILLGFFISWLNYISRTFTLDVDSFDISRGIFNKKEVSIPYRQIQDLDIEQTFFHKLMGVSRLIVLTAGNDEKDKEGESEGIFEVIDSNIAEKLREDLLEKTSIQIVKEVKS
ncbi:MAG: PH domain-containing protein [Candidatus Pacebacteria bacterium]|nr:PH domain-containing protein [Candidatus Paceibacterota bacterium]